MIRQNKGQGLFYTRDSGGKHENTPAQYVEWAQRRADELGVDFAGTPAAIESMIRDGCSAEGSLYLDYEVKGNVLSRKGLDALIKEAITNPRITHIFILRRDRLARPNDAMDGVQLENVLRKAGLTLVFLDKIAGPLGKGTRQDIGDLITGLIDYDRAGKDRRDLAEKILFAQLTLARMGFSTGGRPPFGFRRWLVKPDGTKVRQLADGESVRLAGHHVVWLPGPDTEIELIRRILAMLESMPAFRVAATLTSEGIPSPDAGRWRQDNGIRHRVSGVWNATTIMNIARNPLLVAIVTYGRRSMGDQLRYTSAGPREICDSDFRPDNKHKVIRNPNEQHTTAKAHAEPVVDLDQHNKLLAKLDTRGASQRGKPRSRDPNNNPLGARVFDMDCSWPMYRIPYNGSFRYVCGLYQQSHAQECKSNHVEGPIATQFLLSCIRQRTLSPAQIAKLKEKLHAIAVREMTRCKPEHRIESLRAAVAKVAEEKETVTRNMALAQSPEQFQAMAAVFDEHKLRESKLQNELSEAAARLSESTDVDGEINKALGLLNRLTELGSSAESLATAGELFRLANARLFLRFTAVKLKKRVVQRVAGGVVTLGSAKPPIDIYSSRTDRKSVKSQNRNTTANVVVNPDNGTNASPGIFRPVRKAKSTGNVSRGDRI